MSWYASRQQGHLSRRFMSISLSLNGGQGPFRVDFFPPAFSCSLAPFFFIRIKIFLPRRSETSKINIAGTFSAACFHLADQKWRLPVSWCNLSNAYYSHFFFSFLFFYSESCRIKWMSPRFKTLQSYQRWPADVIVKAGSCQCMSHPSAFRSTCNDTGTQRTDHETM